MDHGVTTAERSRLTTGPEHLWMHDASMNVVLEDGVMTLVKADGVFLEDNKGHRYLDANAGSVAPVILGYGNKAVEEAVIEQLRKLPFAFQAKFANLPAIELAGELCKIAPRGLDKVIFSLAGSDANEIALKVARQYHSNRGKRKYKVIGFWGKYLGTWFGTLSSGGITARRAKFEPLVPGFMHTYAPNYQSCPDDLTFDEYAIECATALDQLIKNEGPETVGAIHTDIIDAHNGMIVPPLEYLRIVRETCDKYDVLLIADEVITGIGRTGKMFACDHYNLVPDILTVAKGVTSGYQPLGATLVQGRIAETFSGEISEAKHFSHAHTYGGNPVSCAAGIATLKEVRDRHLVERVATLGDHLFKRLEELKSNRFVRAARGKGLLAQVELVPNKSSADSFADGVRRSVCISLEMELARRGVLMHILQRPSVLAYLSPPYVVTEEQVELMVSTLESSINAILPRYV